MFHQIESQESVFESYFILFGKFAHIYHIVFGLAKCAFTCCAFCFQDEDFLFDLTINIFLPFYKV